MYHLLRSPKRREGVLPSHYHHPPLTARLQRVFAWLVFVFLVGCGCSFIRAWSQNVQRSGRWDPPPMRWAGGSLRSPPEPTYRDVRLWEDNLPQHNLSLPYPEGENGRYVKFSTQVAGLGWNNVLNELLLCAHLAYDSGRAYVFQEYKWAAEHYPWPVRVWPWQGGPSKPRTPLNALVSGPTAGGNWDDGDEAPRSVSDRWWNTVCADPDDVEIIWSDDAKKGMRDVPGDEVFRHWSSLLRRSTKKCVEVKEGPSGDDGTPQVFDLWILGSKRILPLWDMFKDSPTSRLLSVSPIVASAVARNEHLFLPRGASARRGSPNPYDRMMALHMRRGDYVGQCRHFARYGSSFYGWNQLPFLPDRFEVPSGGETPERTDIYMRRCWPTLEQTLEKVREARDAYIREHDPALGSTTVLDVVHVLSDGDEEWLRALERGLRDSGWGTVVTSKDLALDSEQTGVGMTVDMEIARKAAVFIGNGWSSFTSNIIHRRLVDGRENISNRFW